MFIKAFNLIVPLIYLTVTFSGVTSVDGQYNDFRCKCICPSPQVVSNDTSTSEQPDRSVYIGNVHPHECNCDGVVLPQLTSDVQGKAKEFCPRCECLYESRNITTIRWVVTLIIGVIVCLVIYMGFLMLLDPLLHKGRRSLYEEQVDDDRTEMRQPQEVETDSGSESNPSIFRSPSGSVSGPSRTNSVLGRAVQHQKKWEKTVQEQRKNIYDNHTMLN